MRKRKPDSKPTRIWTTTLDRIQQVADKRRMKVVEAVDVASIALAQMPARKLSELIERRAD